MSGDALRSNARQGLDICRRHGAGGNVSDDRKRARVRKHTARRRQHRRTLGGGVSVGDEREQRWQCWVVRGCVGVSTDDTSAAEFEALSFARKAWRGLRTMQPSRRRVS